MTRITLIMMCATAFMAHARARPKRVCAVEIVKVLDAQIFRGPPYLVETLARNPENAERIRGESHGDHHLTCIYEILINSWRYEYKVELANTRRQLDKEYCGTEKLKNDLANEIFEFTSQCRNPTAKPPRGGPLKPLND